MNDINLIQEKYSSPFASPYLVGVMMAVNAIKDIALYVDGPDCNFYRSDLIYKTHDLFSTLKKPSIDTRLYFSGVMPNKMVRGYDEKIFKKLKIINDNPSFKAGVVTCMPVTGLLSNQYDNIYRDLEKDFYFIPSYTDKFRLDGYSLLLREFAKSIKFDKSKKKLDKNISIIGYLFDRNEGDNYGNIEEIKRILKLIGVEVNSIWLDGGKFEDLKKVEESSLIITLPYGRLAGKVLEKRLGVKKIDTKIPFGLKGTLDFIKDIINGLGLDENDYRDIINHEINKIKFYINSLDDRKFINKKVSFAGDPNLNDGISDFCKILGLSLEKTYSYMGGDYPREINSDILIGNSDSVIFFTGDINLLEFGFPSYDNHFFNNRPNIGFKGFVNFVEDIYNNI